MSNTYAQNTAPTTVYNIRERINYTFKTPHNQAIIKQLFENERSYYTGARIAMSDEIIKELDAQAIRDIIYDVQEDAALLRCHVAVLEGYNKKGRGKDNKPRNRRTSAELAAQNNGSASTALADTASGVSLEAILAVMSKVENLQTKVDRVNSETLTAFDAVTRLASDMKAGKYSPTVVSFQSAPDALPIDLGVQHFNFPKLLRMCNAKTPDGNRLNLWVHGPAGTGKTTAASNVAKALELPFWYNGALESGFQLMGFVDGMGRFQSTQMREAWEHGGVYLFDEIDACMPGALLAFNGALANGLAPFPDGKMIKRHKDCVVIAGANTTGNGGTTEYVGRMKQDAALTNRFCYLDWPIDEQLERAICPDKNWVTYVQAWRKLVNDRGIKNVMITPRASTYGAALLEQGLDANDVTAMVIAKEMSKENFNALVHLVPAYKPQVAVSNYLETAQ